MEKEVETLQNEIRERIVGYITAAFGLVAGLAWNDAIKTLIEVWFPQTSNTLLAKFIYAILITAIVVLVTVYFLRLIRKNK